MENVKEEKAAVAVAQVAEKDVVSSTEYLVSNEDLELAIKNAERRTQLMAKVKALAITQTNSHDWVDMQGKPYLQASGAEKIGRFFGVSWRLLGKPTKEISQDEKGTYYVYSCKGEFFFGAKSIEVLGTCSQRDKFFGRDKNTETGFKSASEVDETNIIKKSVTNCIAKGVTTILGIRNLTWEEINKGGISQEQAAKVTYASGGAGGGKISDAQNKRLFAIAKEVGIPNNTVTDYLKKHYKIESSKDINRKDYEDICKWIEGYKNENTVATGNVAEDKEISL